jgi:hypothetical protein
MFTRATGQTVDGVIAVDVPGLAAVLRTIGPVPNPAGGRPITAENASRVLLRDYYRGLPRGAQSLRRERLADVAAAVVARLTSGRHDAVALGRQLGAAAAGGHFRLWSAAQSEESVFRRTGLGGGPSDVRPERTFHISVQNGTATKLDYFIRHRVEMDVHLTELGTAVIRSTITVQNTAMEDAQSSYQLGPDGAYQSRAGQYIGRIYYWGPRGAIQANAVEESGLMLNSGTLTVEAAKSKQARFETVIPNAVRAGRLELRLVPQPTLVPAELVVRLHAEGWSVDGERVISRPWDRIVTPRWMVAR